MPSAGKRGTRWKLRAHAVPDLQVWPQYSPARPLYEAVHGQSARTQAANCGAVAAGAGGGTVAAGLTGRPSGGAYHGASPTHARISSTMVRVVRCVEPPRFILTPSLSDASVARTVAIGEVGVRAATELRISM